MTSCGPSRTRAVFAGLVLATCATWWLGSATAQTGGALGVAATVTIVVAFTKCFFIGREFMELRSAPLALQAAFNIWVVVVATAAVLLVSV